MNTEILAKLGLSDNQITVYTTLLHEGPSKAGPLSKKTPLKRGLVYKTLEELIELQLISIEDPEAKVTKFVPAHPNTLKELGDKHLEEATSARKQLDHELGSLVSQYNLASGKPGVEFYEGLNGVKKALYQTLDAKDTIYTYADIEAIDQKIGSINADYMKERIKKGIKKKILFIDTEYLRQDMERFAVATHTESRVIKNEDAPPFTTALEIHDGKVTYITFENELLTATVINDKAIYSFHRYLFEYTWKRSQRIR